MAEKKKNIKKYNVTARIVAIVEIPISANSYEEAVEKSKTLRETDFITIDGEYNDGSIRIASISADGVWETDDY